MDKEYWKTYIRQQTKDVETYREAFESVIDTLASILEQRDITYDDYIESGEAPVIMWKSDRGAENLKENPRLKTWGELNTQALAYWRDLGLTPAGLKKINEQAMKKPKRSALAEALKDIG